MFPYIEILGQSLSIYFIFLSLVFTLVVPLIVRRAQSLNLSSLTALDLYLFVLAGSFLGSRLFYVFYQEPDFYLKNPMQILYFWNGGYVFFGGFMGAVLSGLLFCKIKKEKPEEWLNFSIPVLSLGYAVGRLACFLSGCCYGRELNAWWAIFMHQAYRHPTQVYAALMEICIFGLLLFIEKKRGFRARLVLPVWLLLHGLARITMECYRADPRGGELFGMSVSTNISIVLIVCGSILLIFKLKNPFLIRKV